MKKFFILAIVIVAVLVGGVPRSVAVSGYVFFNKEVGEWTVVCWRDVSGGNKACRLSGPPELLAPMTAQNIVMISEDANDVYRVVLEIRDLVAPGLPAFVRIDNHQAHEAPVAKGSATWTGDAAVTIIKEMLGGKNMVFRVHTQPEGLPRDIHVVLNPAFSEAFTAYRQTLRAHKIIGN